VLVETASTSVRQSSRIGEEPILVEIDSGSKARTLVGS
jgi:hypothetical protein